MWLVFRFIALALCLISTSAGAQVSSGAGAPDPFLLSHYGGLKFPPTCDGLGRSPAAVQTIDITKKNLFIITGPTQSNWINTAPSAYTPTNSTKLFNVNICDGVIYAAVDPLLGVVCNPSTSSVLGCATPGCTTNCLGNVILRIGDALITAGKFDNVYLVPTGIGSTSILDWAPGGTLANPGSRLLATLRRLAARGVTTSTTNVTIIDITGIGETDCGNNNATGHPTQAEWVAGWNATQVAAGPLASGVIWFVTKETWNGSVTCSAIQSAQTANSPSGVINNSASIYSAADADSLQGNICGAGANAACRQSDGLHFTDNGNYTLDINTRAAMHTALPSLF